jgi:hypothetical protein
MIERFHFVLNCKNFIQTLYNKKITFKLYKFMKIPVFQDMGLCMLVVIYLSTQQHTPAQVVSCQSLTDKVQVQSQVSAQWICGEQGDIEGVIHHRVVVFLKISSQQMLDMHFSFFNYQHYTVFANGSVNK